MLLGVKSRMTTRRPLFYPYFTFILVLAGPFEGSCGGLAGWLGAVKRDVSQLGGFLATGFGVFMRVGLKSSAKIQKNFEICKFWDTKM